MLFLQSRFSCPPRLTPNPWPRAWELLADLTLQGVVKIPNVIKMCMLHDVAQLDFLSRAPLLMPMRASGAVRQVHASSSQP